MTQELSDSEARDAVVDLGRTFFVEASAGTGKTRLLCDRALAALLTPGYEPSRLVAITFTEKAAAELSARLRAALEDWAAAHPGDEQADHALERFDQAQISTIHSFAASLLRELPVEAAVDPAFQVLDAVGAKLLFEQVWEEWLQAEAERAEGAAPWASAWAHFGSPRLELLERVVAAASAERDAVDVEGYDIPAVDPGEVREAVRAARARFDEVRDRCLDRGDACYRAFASLDDLAQALEAGDVERACSVSIKAGGAKKNWRPGETKDELNEEYLTPVAEALARVCDGRRRAMLPPLVSWLAGAARAFDGRKEELSGLDFHDLLLRAVRLLRRKENGAREYFQRRYRHVLVDEFQDTDPLQVELIFFLAEEGAVATDWRDVALVPGKLFVVGDPKQSIYRFRRADVEIYEAACDVVMREGGEVLRLTDNFRAAPKLVSFVNDAFGGVFGDGEPPYQPAYGALAPSPFTRERQRDAPAARLLEGPDGAFEAEEEAAEAVAAFVRRAVDAGEFEVYDKEAGVRRPLAYRDVALLFRARKNVPAWEEALEAWGVPFYTLGGRTFYVRPEVKAMAAAAQALDNPADVPALVATLTSPLFSFNADDLLRFKLGGGVFDYRVDPPQAVPGRFADALALLKSLHEGRAERSPATTLARLAAKTGLLTKAALWGDGPRAVANVRKVLASARKFVQTGGVGLRAFARWLGEMAGREEAEHESPALEPGDDFVRIMTVHGAKGLEFNAVVFVDWARDAGKGRGETAFVDRRTGLLHVRAGSERDGTQLLTPGYEAAAAREGRFGEAEERRLDYVAATRARDLLVLPRMAEAGENSLAETLAEVEGAARSVEVVRVDAAEERRRIRRPRPEEPAAPDLGPGCDGWKKSLTAELDRAGIPAGVISATDLAKVDEERPAELEEAAPSRPDALKLGSALHAVMEEVDLATGAALEEIAAAACAREGLGDEDAAAVAAWARDCLATAPVREAAAAPACYREMPFAVAVGDAVVTGIADLVYETAEGLVVVDYKTDEAERARRAEGKYGDQMAVYAAALARVTACAVARAYLVFPRAPAGERVVEPGPAAALLSRGEELLGEAPRLARDALSAGGAV
jgi:ATP-dependent helicase/nuclease subunit A